MCRTISPVPEMDKVVGISKLRNSMASIIKDVNKGAHYIIVQRSKAKAVIMSTKEVETLEAMADKDLLKDIRRAKQEILKGNYTTFEEYFGKKIPKKR